MQDKLQNRVREVRESAGLTQAELAQAAGLTVGAISQIERGENEPKLGTAASIARVLGTSVDALFLTPEPTSAVGQSRENDAPAGLVGASSGSGARLPVEAVDKPEPVL